MELLSPPRFTMFQSRRRVSPGWVPFAGTKRKAHVAGIDIDSYDPDCGPAPAKQSAVDEEVARDILKDGYYFDPNQKSSLKTADDEGLVNQDEEMEETLTFENPQVYIRAPGSDTPVNPPTSACEDCNCNVDQLAKSEHRDSGACSLHDSRPVSVSSSSLNDLSSMNAVSLILSDEIQETLARRRLNEDLILPKLLTDKVKQANSMALVVWKPPVTPLAFQEVKETPPPCMNEKETPLQTTTDTNCSFKPSFPSINLTMNSIIPQNSSLDEDEYMDVDSMS